MSSPASPVAIPFSRRPSAAGGGSAGRPSYVTSFQATMSNAHHSNGSSAQLSMSASSAGSMASSASSSSSSANSPTTPNETTIPPQPPTTGKARTSTAAKRASAKAAAAAKKASASTSTGTNTNTGAGSTSRGASSSAGSATPTPASEEKKDWVVPQRAKPGRKPSQEEPLTKRQAQNRASQRAFRERKQNHVATLEKKVEEYEQERLARDAREAEAQQELRSRKEDLEAENAALRQQVKELEVALHQWQLSANANAQAAEAARTHPQASGAAPAWDGCLQAGCRAPAHEVSGSSSMSPPQDHSTTRRKRPLPSRSASSSANRGEGPSSTPDNMGASTSRFGAMSITSAGQNATAAAAPYVYGSGSRSTLLAPLYERPPQENSMSMSTSRSHNAARDGGSPDLMPVSDIDMVDRDCGFCTEDTPCLCRGDVADLRGMDQDANGSSGSAAPVSWMDGVDEMVKIEEQDEEGEDQLATGATRAKADADGGIAFSVPRRPAMAVASLLTTRRTASSTSSKPKLWATTAASSSATDTAPPAAEAAAATGLLQASAAAAAAATTSPSKTLPASKPISSSTAPTRGISSKLWWTQPLSSTGTLSQTSSALYTWTPTALPPGYRATYGGREDDDGDEDDEEDELMDEAMCSGDPANCPACNTDPALAAFCERVAGADDEDEERNGFASEAESSGTASSSATATQRYPYGRPTTTTSRNESRYQSSAAAAAMPPSGDFSFSMQQQQQQQHRGSITGLPSSTPSRPTLPPRSLTTGSTAAASPMPTPTPSFYRRPRGSIDSTSASASTSRLPLPPPLATSPTQHHHHQGSGTSPPSQGFSIPSAFRQLRAHPGFPKWQGGLDLLADVVSGRSGSPTGPNTSAVRGSGEPSASQPPTQQQQQHHKRRRLYLENDRVEEALRLLDGGVAGGSAATSGRAVAETVPCGECPCPCPWARPAGEAYAYADEVGGGEGGRGMEEGESRG